MIQTMESLYINNLEKNQRIYIKTYITMLLLLKNGNLKLSLEKSTLKI